MEPEMLIVNYINMLSASMRQSMQKYREMPECADLFKLTITQLHYLHAINEVTAVTFRDLVSKFKVQKPTVTDIVNRLIKRGLVAKQQSAEDRRVFHLHLTEKGQQLLQLESMGYYQFAQKMTACLNSEEKALFTAILQKSTAGLQA